MHAGAAPIIPGPIAWVTSLSPEWVAKLAQFGALACVSRELPLIGIAVMRRGGGLRDAARNIAARGDFTVSIADKSLVDWAHLSAIERPPVSVMWGGGEQLRPHCRIAGPICRAGPCWRLFVGVGVLLFHLVEYQFL